MRIALAILLVLTSGFNDLDKIAKANKLKKEAREAYQNGDYTTAIDNYHYLLDSMNIDDDKIRLNLANAYYQLKDTTNAQNRYSALTESENSVIRSTAYQQNGIIQNAQKKHKEALQSFKNALKSDPTNEGARYNYELVKKLIKEQEEQQKDQNQENKDQQKQDQENNDQQDQQQQDQQKQDQENKDQEQQDQEQDQENKEGESEEEKEQKEKEGEDGEEKEQEPKEGEERDEQKDAEQKDMPQQPQDMKDMKISEEKAKMILEAMKNSEIQYFQQNKRKPTKRKDSDKPDW